MYLCIKCGNTHTQMINFNVMAGEPVCKCCNQEVIEVDEGLSRIILCLNKNGLETLHSCEGHFVGDDNTAFSGNTGYISIFDPENNVSEKLSEIPDNIGNFVFIYEDVQGPRSFHDRTFINKFVLRWDYKPPFEFIKKYDYMMDKIKMLQLLDEIIVKCFKINKELTYGEGK